MSSGPRGRKSRDPIGSQKIHIIPDYQISFDAHAFNHAVRSQGIVVEHHKGMPNPVGMLARNDIHAVGAKTTETSDGLRYFKGGEAEVLFTVNGTSPNHNPTGQVNDSVAYLTLPTTYCNSEEPLLVALLDRFYVKDIEARAIAMQYIETNPLGIDKLQYPATCIEKIIDAKGNEYKEGQHFELTPEGHVKWISQERPGWDQVQNKGVVYSVRYRYTPFFVVGRIMHEIRVFQTTDPKTNKRSVIRAPYQVMIVRENVFRDVNNAEKMLMDLKDERFQNLPPVGGNMGPRSPG